MPKILIENIFKKELIVKEGTKPLLRHFHDHHVDWMHSCGGKGRCTTCKVIVLKGLENFAALTNAEISYQRQGTLLMNERLSCQAIITGDIVVAVPKEYKLPHIKYSE